MGAREGLERVGQEGGTSQSARRTAPKGFGERNLEGQQLGSPLYSELPNAWSSQKRALPQGSPCPVGSPHFVSIARFCTKQCSGQENLARVRAHAFARRGPANRTIGARSVGALAGGALQAGWRMVGGPAGGGQTGGRARLGHLGVFLLRSSLPTCAIAARTCRKHCPRACRNVNRAHFGSGHFTRAFV